jgi:hypothetical protein
LAGQSTSIDFNLSCTAQALVITHKRKPSGLQRPA